MSRPAVAEERLALTERGARLRDFAKFLQDNTERVGRTDDFFEHRSAVDLVA